MKTNAKSTWTVISPCSSFKGIFEQDSRPWPNVVLEKCGNKIERNQSEIWLRQNDPLVEFVVASFLKSYKFPPYSIDVNAFDSNNFESSDYFIFNPSEKWFLANDTIVFENQLTCGNPPPKELILGKSGCGQLKKQIANLTVKQNMKVPKDDFYTLCAGPRFSGREFAVSERFADAIHENSFTGVEIRAIETADGEEFKPVKQLTVTGTSNPVETQSFGKLINCETCGFVYFQALNNFPIYQRSDLNSFDFQVLDSYKTDGVHFRGASIPRLLVSGRVLDIFEKNKFIGSRRASKFAKYLAVPIKE